MNRRSISTVVALGASAALALAAAPATGAPPGGAQHGVTRAAKQTLAAGIQTAPKSTKQIGPNPFIANLPDPTKADYFHWRTEMNRLGKARANSAELAAAQKAAGLTAKTVLVHDEEEPAGTVGANDTLADAEPITGFGTGRGDTPRLRILGAMPELPPGPTSTIDPINEDNGSIPLAGDTGLDALGSVTTTGTLGDGPHGSDGDASGDFDFYSVEGTAGLTLTADTSGLTVDTIALVYDQGGTLVAADDDGGEGLASLVTYSIPTTGTYYVAIVGFRFGGSLPDDPFDSGSGPGVGAEGDYNLSIAQIEVDKDYYSLDLAKGDIIGAVINGDPTGLSVHTPGGAQRVVSDLVDASSLYPFNSPLPGGGNTTLAYVAERTGRYVLGVAPAVGAYDVTVDAFRPGTETDRSAKVQTVYLDFDGATVNTAKWGGPGVRTLSGLGTFLSRWGLTRADEPRLIRAITAEVRENLVKDAQASLNDHVQVKVVNSLTSPDIYGQTNVARVIVGGTILQSGIPTIGIAQFIDPGNFGHEDDALVLLDVLSDPDEGRADQASGDGASLNTYLEPRSDRLGFVAQAVGNVVSHEIGHTIGNYHTDSFNAVRGLMEAGGCCLGPNLFAVGSDHIGGTADDPDRDFLTDTYNLNEGFEGRENTFNVAAWAYVKPVR